MQLHTFEVAGYPTSERQILGPINLLTTGAGHLLFSNCEPTPLPLYGHPSHTQMHSSIQNSVTQQNCCQSNSRWPVLENVIFSQVSELSPLSPYPVLPPPSHSPDPALVYRNQKTASSPLQNVENLKG